MTTDKDIENAFLEWIRPIEETMPDRLDCFTAGYAAGRKAALPSREEFVREVSDLTYNEMYDYLASRIKGER
jgi:hypothetical protein